jgi:mannitol/fructose-specific phosphotransferase system IIA component (Ntr-type)
MNMGQNTTISDGYCSQKLAQFFIIPHCKLNVSWNNTILLVVYSSVPSQFQNLNQQK